MTKSNLALTGACGGFAPLEIPYRVACEKPSRVEARWLLGSTAQPPSLALSEPQGTLALADMRVNAALDAAMDFAPRRMGDRPHRVGGALALGARSARTGCGERSDRVRSVLGPSPSCSLTGCEHSSDPVRCEVSPRIANYCPHLHGCKSVLISGTVPAFP